jgi:PilZ domain
MTDDRRQSPRRKVLKGARIAFASEGIACTVRNLSETGAGLDVADPLSLPPSFMLVIDRDGFTRRCHPVWCNGRRVGVAFD